MTGGADVDALVRILFEAVRAGVWRELPEFVKDAWRARASRSGRGSKAPRQLKGQA